MSSSTYTCNGCGHSISNQYVSPGHCGHCGNYSWSERKEVSSGGSTPSPVSQKSKSDSDFSYFVAILTFIVVFGYLTGAMGAEAGPAAIGAFIAAAILGACWLALIKFIVFVVIAAIVFAILTNQ